MLRIIHFLNDIKKKEVTTTPQIQLSTTALPTQQPRSRMIINFIFKILDEAAKHGGIGGL